MRYAVLFILPPESGVEGEMFGLRSSPENISLALSDGVGH